jgi:hypothetical protein
LACSKVALTNPTNFWCILNSFIASSNFSLFMAS